MIPGGYEEATITHRNKERIYIKSRKGFIVYALKHGYKVHPAYNFGETKAYFTFNFFEPLGLLLNKFKLPGVFALGKYFLLPIDDIEMHYVIGKGIQFPVITKPTKEEVEKYHDIYLNELKALYYRYNEKYDCSKHLEIY